MKKFVLLLLFIIFLSSCSVNSGFSQTASYCVETEKTAIELLDEIEKTTYAQQDFVDEEISVIEKNCLKLNSIKPTEDIQIPFVLDLTTNDWLNNAYSVHKHIKWYVETIGKDTYSFDGSEVDKETLVLRCVSGASSAAEVPATGAGPSLYIGNSELKNYNFSFDFFTKDNSGLNFSIYTESLSTEWREGEKQPFYFTLGSGHGLSFETAFGTGSFFYKSEDGEILLNDFDSSVWNTVELIMYDYDLHFVFNGIDYGVIYTFDGTQHGGAAIGCNGNVMFKNIKLTPLV